MLLLVGAKSSPLVPPSGSDVPQSASSATMASGSSAVNTAEPATNTSAPASAHRSIVSRDTPPSTYSQMSPPCLSISVRARWIFGRQTSRNFWPPKPGSTVMISTMSSSGSRSS